MDNFQENQEKIINYQVKLTNQTPPPFVNLDPLSRNPGSAPASITFLKYIIILYADRQKKRYMHIF